MVGGRGPGNRGRLHRGGCQWRLERVAWVEDAARRRRIGLDGLRECDEERGREGREGKCVRESERESARNVERARKRRRERERNSGQEGRGETNDERARERGRGREKNSERKQDVDSIREYTERTEETTARGLWRKRDRGETR